jgi:hypothetical protein
MRRRLFSVLMVFVALSLVLSLVAMLAPDAGAQDSGTAPDGPAKWMRYNVPAAPDLQAAGFTNVPIGFTSKTCCIIVLLGPIPTSDLVIGSESPTSSNPYSSPSRWFCMRD